MHITRRGLIGAGAGAACTVFAAGSGKAQGSNVIRIGHLTDMSGVYRDSEGPTGVACAHQAVEEFTAANPDIAVELLVADHQNKADVGLSIIRQWFSQGVDVLNDVGNSSIALGAKGLIESADKVSIVSSAGSSDLTGKACSANQVHWSWDSWCLAHSTATAMTQTGGDKWFFITADYAFGHIAQADATKFIDASGGRVVGSVLYPLGATTDFSSQLLQASSSGCNVIAFANTGADLVNCLKQVQEFGTTRNGIRIAAMVGNINEVMAMGLPVGQGLSITETFYWDLNDRTRAFMGRLRPKLPAATFPNLSQAGDYGGLVHYLKVVKQLGVARAKASGRETVAAMKSLPTDDDCFGVGRIRADGRVIHPAYLFQVKTPAESHYVGDVYKVVATIPAEEAFRPMNQGGCSLVQG